MAMTKTNDKAVTRTSQAALAQKIVEGLRALRELIPDYEPAPRAMPFVIRNRAATPTEFLDAAATAMERSELLATSALVPPDRIREAVAFSAAFQSAADEAEALARAIRFVIARRRAEAAASAMVAYDIAKSHGKRTDSNDLVSHTREMHRALGKRGLGRRGKAAARTDE